MTPPAQRRGFGRDQRIKHGRDFSRVREQGGRLACGCLVANWLRLPLGSPTRLGVVAGAKVGGSVVRSRVKRLLRESFRLHQFDLNGPVDLVLVARPSIAGKPYSVVERDFLSALRRAGLLQQVQQVQL